MKNWRVAALTLGCKVNHYETDALLAGFRRQGLTVVPFSEEADIYLINTCTVTSEAGRKSAQMIRRARRRNPAALIVAVGCHVEAAEKLPEADLWISNSGKPGLVDRVLRCLAGDGDERAPAAATAATTLTAAARDYLDFAPFAEQSETRAVVKIQDGCDRFCSYCIIPLVRGPARSRPAAAVLDEGRRLVAAGYRELVLTGIHLNSYGREGGTGLGELLQAVDRLPGLERLRLGSLDPAAVDEDFALALKTLTKLCPHFHLSLQSGSAAVLERMHRPYTPDEYRLAAERLRNCRPEEVSLTTDVIVGFPGETEAEHLSSLAFCRELGFARMHVFRYSARPGTAAACFPDAVPEALKSRRAGEMQELARELWQGRLGRLAGRSDQLLLEEQRADGVWLGYGLAYDALELECDSGELEAGRLLTVRHEGVTGRDPGRALVMAQ
ncbi:MAG: tRNA (N(6)-L-threonylcarbamoyladenosine(37)-C(2))-methylthiotransferase MtaB [Bacillota bacterium]|nr:tRNA (N(6)-L-threonylcarbamoyladenosine(37)-C(2))-methylthiotransferase MtaB [Bacillota bacterium]